MREELKRIIDENLDRILQEKKYPPNTLKLVEEIRNSNLSYESKAEFYVILIYRDLHEREVRRLHTIIDNFYNNHKEVNEYVNSAITFSPKLNDFHIKNIPEFSDSITIPLPSWATQFRDESPEGYWEEVEIQTEKLKMFFKRFIINFFSRNKWH